MIEQLKEDETLAVNGCTVTARNLAAARQQLAHDGALLPTWDELTPDEQRTSAIEAAGWLRSLGRIAPTSLPVALAERITASQRAYEKLAAESWEVLAVDTAVRYRGMAEGLAMALDHLLAVAQEQRRHADA